jgi:hypothetical protein
MRPLLVSHNPALLKNILLALMSHGNLFVQLAGESFCPWRVKGQDEAVERAKAG